MDNKPLVTIITVSYNSEKFIEDNINSVLNQNYENIEHIIVDGNSTDRTIDIIKNYQIRYKKSDKELKWTSEKDKGIYDAMNKGIDMASGDIIGILNSDDFYTSKNSIKCIINCFEKEKNLDGCYGIIEKISSLDKEKTIRISRMADRKNYFSKFKYGWHPPHQSIFVKKHVYIKYGKYNLKYKLAADFDFLCRIFEKKNLRIKFIPKIIIKMRLGGESNKNIRATLNGLYESFLVLKDNNIIPFFIFIKPLRKLFRNIKYIFKKSL